MKKNAHIIAVLLITAVVCLFYASQKSGFHIDELYSFGLSNSYYAPYITDIKDGDIVDQVFTRQELIDYLTVGDDDAFAFGSVYYNQTKDVHPPLFYWFLNFVSSIFKDVGFSKWPALGMNLVFYLASLIILYKLAFELFDSRFTAASACILYGLSSIGISTFLLIRMYTLLTFWTLLLAYLILRHFRTGKKKYCLSIFLCIFAGMMTQYYFVFYAFFLCAAYDIYLLISRKFKTCLLFSVSAICGVALMVLCFPACIDHIFVGNGQVVSGANALDNLGNIHGWLEKFSEYSKVYLKLRVFVRLFIILLSCSLTLLVINRRKHSESVIKFRVENFIIIVPAFLAAVIVFIVSPVVEQRYIYNLIPILILSICPAITLVIEYLEKLPYFKVSIHLFYIILIVLSIAELKSNSPDYLFKEENDYSAVTEEYCTLPCVYFDDNYFAPITADLLQLLKYDNFLVVNDSNSPALKEYIGNSDRFITYVDNSWYWSGGVYSELVRWRFEEDTGYSNSEQIYEHGLSITYAFSKSDT